MRPALRRKLFACLLAFAVLLVFGIWMMMRPGAPGYVQIQGLGYSKFYVQFSDHSMAMAETIPALKDAKPIKANSATDQLGYVVFPEVPVPFSAEALPPGVTSVHIQLSLSPEPRRWQVKFKAAELIPRSAVPQRSVQGRITSFRTDVNNVRWAYVQPFANLVGEAPDLPYIIKLGCAEKVTLTLVQHRTAEDAVDVTVLAELGAGHCRLCDIRRNGTSVEALIRVLDSDGKVISSIKGPLSMFGFG